MKTTLYLPPQKTKQLSQKCEGCLFFALFSIAILLAVFYNVGYQYD